MPGLGVVSEKIADRDVVKQVLLILLDNSLKHSNGDVRLAAERWNGQVEIRVQDSGPGIAADKLDKVFDRFYRGEESAVSQGFGLGLPIAKALTKGMGGTIAIESVLGSGSTIIVRFPAVDENDSTSESSNV
ncbi:MAG: sensor histidine kinase [Chloroflexota bacterium]